MKTHFASLLLVLAATFGCANADFAGQSAHDRKPAKDAAPQPKVQEPSAPVTVPATTPALSTTPETTETATDAPVTTTTGTSSLPKACENTISTTGVVDQAKHRVYKLMPNQLGYDDGVAACAAQGSDGRMIYIDQDLPDAVLACQKALGVLWLRPSADASLALWQPTYGGNDARDVAHWIICYATVP